MLVTVPLHRGLCFISHGWTVMRKHKFPPPPKLLLVVVPITATPPPKHVLCSPALLLWPSYHSLKIACPFPPQALVLTVLCPRFHLGLCRQPCSLVSDQGMNVCATGLHETKPVEDRLSLVKDGWTLGAAQDFAKFLQLAGFFLFHDTVDSLGSL